MRRAVLSLVVVLSASPVFAQSSSQEDPVANAPIRLGVLGLGPKVTLENLGVDTNVFNAPEDPKEDFTFTLAPELDIWMRTGRGLLTLNGKVELVYFNQYSSERSVNPFGSARYEYRFNRLRPWVFASALDTRERPGYEIDVRARRFENHFHGGFDVRTGSKSDLTLAARREVYEYAGDEVFNGEALNQSLNRTLDAVDAGWRQRLTVLTTWLTTVSVERERFEFETARNSDSLHVQSGFELARLALIRGRAYVGYRKLDAADGGTLPSFSGVTADTSVFYTAPTQTRIGAGVTRDVEYSYEDATPYYVRTSVNLNLTQRVIGRWDIQVTGSRGWLAYRGVGSEDTDRTDVVDDVGAGIGYQLNDDVRVSFDAVSSNRRSELPGRDYRTLRYGLNASYAF